MADNWTAYEQPVRDEINVPYGDDERVSRAIQAAISYVNGALGGQTVGQEVMTDCVISCAADLYNSRDARLGVMSVGDGTLEPFRVSTDPLRSVWPKLNAAGILTGSVVIA